MNARKKMLRAKTVSLAKNKVRLHLLNLEGRVVPTTFTATNTNDSGTGSLRQAIIDANNNSGADSVSINIGGSHTITLTTGQLSITDSAKSLSRQERLRLVEGGIAASLISTLRVPM